MSTNMDKATYTKFLERKFVKLLFKLGLGRKRKYESQESTYCENESCYCIVFLFWFMQLPDN